MILEIELNEDKFKLDVSEIDSVIKRYKDEGSDDDWWDIVDVTNNGKGMRLDINITNPEVFGGETSFELNYAIYHVDEEGETDHTSYVTMEEVNKMIEVKQKEEKKLKKNKKPRNRL